MSLNESTLYRGGSLFWSALLSVMPPALYLAARSQSGPAEMLLAAAFYLSIAALFFLAIWRSRDIAVLALVRWVFESFAVFGRGYRLHFYGLLALCGAISHLVKAARLLSGD